MAGPSKGVALGKVTIGGSAEFANIHADFLPTFSVLSTGDFRIHKVPAGS